MFGDHHELVLHYYLADDTIEILEKVPPNSGRDGIPVFLIRAKLPKVVYWFTFCLYQLYIESTKCSSTWCSD